VPTSSFSPAGACPVSVSQAAGSAAYFQRPGKEPPCPLKSLGPRRFTETAVPELGADQALSSSGRRPGCGRRRWAHGRGTTSRIFCSSSSSLTLPCCASVQPWGARRPSCAGLFPRGGVPGGCQRRLLLGSKFTSDFLTDGVTQKDRRLISDRLTGTYLDLQQRFVPPGAGWARQGG